MSKKLETRYRKKPVTIQAIQYDGKNGSDIFQALGKGFTVYTDHIEIFTLEGVMRAEPGDWIIKGVVGEIYPCKPDIFKLTYEPEEALRNHLLKMIEDARDKMLPLTWLAKEFAKL